MREDRYLSKIEKFMREQEFIKSHKIRDTGLKVEDDATNIEKLLAEGVISKKDSEFLREMNGVRNFIVNRYERLEMDIVKEALERIGELEEIIVNIVES